MSDDIPAMIEDTRTDADDLEADGRDWDAKYLRELATALEVERARANEAVADRQLTQDAITEYADRYQQAQARIAALEAALEPFRKLALDLENNSPFPKNIGAIARLQVRVAGADIARARAVLEKADE